MYKNSENYIYPYNEIPVQNGQNFDCVLYTLPMEYYGDSGNRKKR